MVLGELKGGSDHGRPLGQHRGLLAGDSWTKASRKRSGAGPARHRGHDVDVEMLRWHDIFREQLTDHLGQEAGGEDHKEVVVKL